MDSVSGMVLLYVTAMHRYSLHIGTATHTNGFVLEGIPGERHGQTWTTDTDSTADILRSGQ